MRFLQGLEDRGFVFGIVFGLLVELVHIPALELFGDGEGFQGLDDLLFQ